jgi:hypothetical protein
MKKRRVCNSVENGAELFTEENTLRFFRFFGGVNRIGFRPI